MKVAREGASVAGDARRKIEAKTGKSVISKQNAKELKEVTAPPAVHDGEKSQ
ncbi:MAG: hypothetical protein LBU89_01460 [Fibromonadaceae bacterium]|nr:hypothetical protein [Fibromonadaceae bacterium]